MSFGYVGPVLDREYEVVWKTEGATDALAVYDLICEAGLEETHTAVTNDCGATQRPSAENDWFAAKMKGANVYVLHDCDEPGQLGALGDGKRPGWCSAIARHAKECRNVILPYGITESSGKDARDWIGEQIEAGKSKPAIYEELLAMASTAEVVEPWQGGGSLPVETIDPDDIDADQLEYEIDDPHQLALANLEFYNDLAGGTLRYHQQTWWRYREGQYRQIPNDNLRTKVCSSIKRVYVDDAKRRFTEWINKGDMDKPKPKVKKVTTGTVNDVLLAMASEVCLSSSISMPAKISDKSKPLWVSLENGILDLDVVMKQMRGEATDSEPLLPHTPNWFSTTKLPYAFDINRKCPIWQEFLLEAFDGDVSSVTTLQKWCGYLLTGEMHLHKILMVIGPPRSGKGTISRTIMELLGSETVATPSLNSLANNFVGEGLIGKTVALVPDARLSKRVDSVVLTERLLSISGEDPQMVDRKNKSILSAVKLPLRFTIFSNLAPGFVDPAGAIMSRLIFLKMKKSYVGREDQTLGDRILTELPGILNWAIAGRFLLEREGLLQPKSGQDLIDDTEMQSAPVKVFLRECCDHDPELSARDSVRCEDLYNAYNEWAEENGAKKINDPATFGKAMRNSGASFERKKCGGERKYFYVGIGLKHMVC